jgi:hypothetical protein
MIIQWHNLYWQLRLLSSIWLCQFDTFFLQGSWVQLLQNAQYGGAWESSTGFAPLAHGSFTAFKAVYKSGFVTCDRVTRSDYHWQECGSNKFSFELKKNGDFVVEAPDWGTLPAECRAPATLTGDIVCVKALTIKEGDRLTPTWYEPSHQTSTSDNDGTITIDLYGWTDVSILVRLMTGLFFLIIISQHIIFIECLAFLRDVNT